MSKSIKILISFSIVSAGLLWLRVFSKDSSVYVKPILGLVKTLDPQLTRERRDYMISRNIFGQLLRYDEYGNIKPELLKTWQVDSEGKKYTFELSDNIFFHDGLPFTSEDATFSFHYLSTNKSLVSNYFSNIVGFDEFHAGRSSRISGIRVLSDKKFEVNLKSKSYVFLTKLADPKIVVLPNKLRGKSAEDFFKLPIGTGPYRVKSKSTNEINLIRFEQYRGKKPKVIEYKLVSTIKSDAVRGLMSGQFQDVESYNFSVAELKNFINTKQLAVYSKSAFSGSFLFFNGHLPVFSDARIRSVLSKMIDIRGAIEACDLNAIPLGGISPHGAMGHKKLSSTPQEVTPADIQYVHRVFEKNGIKELRILSYGNAMNPCLFKALTSLFVSKMEIKFRLISTNLGEAVQIFNSGRYELFFEELSVRGSEPYFLYSYFAPDSIHNLTKFRDPHISTLIRGIEKTQIKSQRALEYRRASNYIADEMNYVIPLFSDVRGFVFRSNVKGETIPATIMSNVGFEEVWLK